jgi:hypothetical protein
MKYTNKHNLPQPIVDAIIAIESDYDSEGSDITASSLDKPPQMLMLLKKHDDEIVVDVSNRLYSLLGNATHIILERAGEGGVRIMERRFTEMVNGWKVSGKVDLIEDRILWDYKVMSVWEIIYGLKKDKENQVNVLRWLAEKGGVKVEKLGIAGILRDWQYSKAKFDHKYPQEQGVKVDIPLWDMAKAHDYISERVSVHKVAREFGAEPCTDEERWMKPAKWAVMKTGRKSALRVLESEEDARNWLHENSHKGGDEIVHRPGENTRCDTYCDVKGFCQQYKSMQDGDI